VARGVELDGEALHGEEDPEPEMIVGANVEECMLTHEGKEGALLVRENQARGERDGGRTRSMSNND
jgi:hypothetical protein